MLAIFMAMVFNPFSELKRISQYFTLRLVSCSLSTMCLFLFSNMVAAEVTNSLTATFHGAFALATCDSTLYDANNNLVPSGVIILPSIDSSEANPNPGSQSQIGEKVTFKIGPVRPTECVDLLSTYRVDLQASGYTDGDPDVLVNQVSVSNGPTNIGVEILAADGSGILSFSDLIQQTIDPLDPMTTLVPLSAQLYNRYGQAPDNDGLISATATFTTAYY
jgi:type 1 fimbria pilin